MDFEEKNMNITVEKVRYQVLYVDDDNKKHRAISENPLYLQFIEDRFVVLECKPVETGFHEEKDYNY